MQERNLKQCPRSGQVRSGQVSGFHVLIFLYVGQSEAKAAILHFGST